MKKICVIGSINIDLVIKVKRFVKPGETMTGKEFAIFPGGKGANQGVAVGKLGCVVDFLGKVGQDAFQNTAIDAFQKANVNTSYIETEKNINTGIAMINVTDKGENSIVLSPGANGMVDVDYLQKYAQVIDDCDYVMLQLEIPMEAVKWAAAYGKKKNKIIILDPAPAVDLEDELLQNIDYITPNQTEMELLTGFVIDGEEDVQRAGEKLLERGVKSVIHKAGKKGAYLIDQEKIKRYGIYDVKVEDTTAAGDSFNAGFVAALAKEYDMDKALDYANAVASLSVMKFGAQSAMPSHQDTLELMSQKKPL